MRITFARLLSPTDIARFRAEYLKWELFIGSLLSPSNCTPRFWEMFGPAIQESRGVILEIEARPLDSYHKKLVLGLLKASDENDDRHTPENWEIMCFNKRESLATLLSELEKLGFPDLPQFKNVLDLWRADQRDPWGKDFQEQRSPDDKRYDSPKEMEQKLSEFLSIEGNNTRNLWKWCKNLSPDNPSAKLIDKMAVFLLEAYSYEQIYKPPRGWPQYWESANHLFDECLRALARLTQQPDGALVPLWDVLDEQKYDRSVCSPCWTPEFGRRRS